MAADICSADLVLVMHRHAVLLGLVLDGVEQAAPAGPHARYVAHALIVMASRRTHIVVMLRA